MAVKKWYSDIAELRDMHKIYVVTRDISGENSSKEIREFLESKGIQNVRAMAEWPSGIVYQFSHETWPIGDGLGGQFWFSAMMAAKDARNATFKERIGSTPWMLMHGRKRDVSKFRAFGCRAYIYIDEERRGKGKHIPGEVEAINLGFATDHKMSAYRFYVSFTRKIMLCNQAKVDELFFPYRTRGILERDKDDHSTNILGRVPSGSKWIPYDNSIPSNLYEKVHYDRASDALMSPPPPLCACERRRGGARMVR